VDAPVSGGDVGAANATLSIMAGGDAAHVEAVRPWLQRLGRIIVHHGAAGAGQHAKMVNQILIAGAMMGLSEGMVYARRAGLDPLRVIESVGSGAAGSWSVTNLAPRVARGDFEPGFAVEHFIKDLSIALEEAAALGLALPGLALARQLYQAASAHGFGRKGTHVLYRVVESLCGMGAGPPPAPRL
jgi:3-hydroxyisobutyrate dehydrogenase